MKQKRNIIEINEDLCNGCGQCVLDCAEGAIEIRDGKAKVIADFLCDGLGACLSGCPTDALKIITREADDYDEAAVEKHLAAHGRVHHKEHHGHDKPHDGHHHEGDHHKHEHHAHHGEHHGHHHAHHGEHHGHHHGGGCGCKSSAAMAFPMSGGWQASAPKPSGCGCGSGKAASFANATWPLKLRLMSPEAPFLKDADLVIAADCTAFAAPCFHQEFRDGKILLIACPKFEDREDTIERLAAVFRKAKSCTIVRMEVPCCKGLTELCKEAAKRAGRVDLPLEEKILTRQGEVQG